MNELMNDLMNHSIREIPNLWCPWDLPHEKEDPCKCPVPSPYAWLGDIGEKQSNEDGK